MLRGNKDHDRFVKFLRTILRTPDVAANVNIDVNININEEPDEEHEEMTTALAA